MYFVLFHSGNSLLTWCDPRHYHEHFKGKWRWSVEVDRDWTYIRVLGFELSFGK